MFQLDLHTRSVNWHEVEEPLPEIHNTHIMMMGVMDAAMMCSWVTLTSMSKKKSPLKQPPPVHLLLCWWDSCCLGLKSPLQQDRKEAADRLYQRLHPASKLADILGSVVWLENLTVLTRFCIPLTIQLGRLGRVFRVWLLQLFCLGKFDTTSSTWFCSRYSI